MRRFLALCAGAALSVAVAGSGCGGNSNYSPGPESGGAKGPEIQSASTQGQPVSGSASQQAQSTGPPNYMPITPDHATPDGGTTLDASVNGTE